MPETEAAGLESPAPAPPLDSRPPDSRPEAEKAFPIPPPAAFEAPKPEATPESVVPEAVEPVLEALPDVVDHINAPTDIFPEPEEDAAPSAGWRVPSPPEMSGDGRDPLDDILAGKEPSFLASSSTVDEEAGIADQPETQDLSEDQPVNEADKTAEETGEETGEDAADIAIDNLADSSMVSEMPDEITAPEALPEIAEEAIEEVAFQPAEGGETLEAVGNLADSSIIREIPDETEAPEALPEIAEDAVEEVAFQPAEGGETLEAVDNLADSSIIREIPDETEAPEALPEIAEEAIEEVAFQPAEGSETLEAVDEAAEPEAPVPDAAPVEDIEPESEAEPEPTTAPHWSELIPAKAAVAATAQALETAIPKEETAEIPPSATQDMEDLIRTFSTDMPSAASVPRAVLSGTTASAPSEPEEVFHPWEDSEKTVAAEAEVQETDDDDDFDWEELPEEAPRDTSGFDPVPGEDSPEASHIAKIKAQNAEDIKSDLPEISNIIQADIPQAATATMSSTGSSNAAYGKPSKPTQMGSPEDVDAAIREQLTSLKKPSVRSRVKPQVEKLGLFSRIAKLKAKPEPKPALVEAPRPVPKSTNPLKDALLLDDGNIAPRSRVRLGFFLALYTFLIGLALYLLGDQISNAVPAVEPFISLFTAMVDGLRSMTQGWFGG
ncbi:MAG: hypothetical protein L3J37_02185 [Rhodobacteraceae bacterium]|nr:hypothetical protein [Paracoccaceae bacterium]